MSDTGFNSEIVQKGSLLPGIHGLRGIAACAIVLFHLEHLSGIKPPEFFHFMGRDFQYSVHLFFILSAFSLMHSNVAQLHRQQWFADFFIKRFFRIAPLFYSIMLFEITRQAVNGGITQDIKSVLLNLTFTFGFVPFSSFVWAGWAVGVEMIFYALFPVLILTIRTHKSALLFMVLSVVISYYVRSGLHAQYLSTTPLPKLNWSNFAFPSNLCYFAMGLYAYRVSHLVDRDSLITRIAFPFVAITLMGGLMFFSFGEYLYGGGRIDIIVWGISLTALCIWQSISPSRAVANIPFVFLGERSFSIYLLHPIIIWFSRKHLVDMYDHLSLYVGSYAFFICAIPVFLVILLFTEFTFRLIEVPGIVIGRRLINFRRKV